MGLTVKNKTSYELGENLTEFFSLPIDEPPKQDEYNKIKDAIYKLDIDNEEKANIINKINSLKQIKTSTEKKKILKEITDFRNEYDI